jgi:hypothetical protein
MYQTTRRHVPDDRNHNLHRYENVKFYILKQSLHVCLCLCLCCTSISLPNFTRLVTVLSSSYNAFMNVCGERVEEVGLVTGIDSCTYCMILIFCCATGRNSKWQVLKIVKREIFDATELSVWLRSSVKWAGIVIHLAMTSQRISVYVCTWYSHTFWVFR